MEPNESLIQAYRQHGPRVLAYLRARIKDRHDCEDLLQEVFLGVAGNLAALKQAKSPIAWLLGIARNLSREYSRKHKFAAIDSLDGITASRERDESDLQEMRRAIAALPSMQREVLELR